jgi:hypothetical protein
MGTKCAFDRLRARWMRRVVIVMALLTLEDGMVSEVGRVKWAVRRDGFDVVCYANR